MSTNPTAICKVFAYSAFLASPRPYWCFQGANKDLENNTVSPLRRLGYNSIRAIGEKEKKMNKKTR